MVLLDVFCWLGGVLFFFSAGTYTIANLVENEHE